MLLRNIKLVEEFDKVTRCIENELPDLKAELVAIMWIGREDYHPDDWCLTYV